MKYGILFSILGALLLVYALANGNWFLILLWPALSCGLIASGYLGWGPSEKKKKPDGSLSLLSLSLLLPYLLYAWTAWHIVRIFSRESPYHSLGSELKFGRRLLSSELPEGTQTVVDLTSEFPEPAALRAAVTYISFPMLDASSLAPAHLAAFAQDLCSAQRPIYIHCAQGHGRTGLITALFLIACGKATNVEDAMRQIQLQRPLAKLSPVQKSALQQAASILQETD